MLGYIWVSVGGALSNAAGYWISEMSVQRCWTGFLRMHARLTIAG
jgi:hypothetical protein